MQLLAWVYRSWRAQNQPQSREEKELLRQLIQAHGCQAHVPCRLPLVSALWAT